MEKVHLAKSNPKETIQEHTEKLIQNYNKLKTEYPNLKIDWGLLYLACLYHDLGKMNKKFQDKLNYKKKSYGEIPHGILSLIFIDYEQLEENGYLEEEIRLLFQSIAYHHDRELNYSTEELEKEIEDVINQFEDFKYDRLDRSRFIAEEIEDQFFTMNERIYQHKDGEELFLKYVMLKGLLNRIDYAASADIAVENRNDFLENGLENLLESWKNENPKSEWNELQKYMKENQDKNLIAVAQTGMGKTDNVIKLRKKL